MKHKCITGVPVLVNTPDEKVYEYLNNTSVNLL